MAQAGIALMIVSMLMQAKQGADTASAQKQEGAYLQQQADTNSRLANMQAADALERGQEKSDENNKQTKKLVGKQRAAMAAQGLDLDEEDALLIQNETVETGAVDSRTIKNNAWREAWGYRVQAQDSTNQGQWASITSKQKAKSTILTTGLGIVNTGLQTYGAYKTPTKSVARA